MASARNGKSDAPLLNISTLFDCFWPEVISFGSMSLPDTLLSIEASTCPSVKVPFYPRGNKELNSPSIIVSPILGEQGIASSSSSTNSY